MTAKVLIIGGYGNFGQRISEVLATDEAIQIIVGGRNESKAKAFVKTLKAVHTPLTCKIDIQNNLVETLKAQAPDIVIHTSGPYQEQGYEVALACIEAGAHYIDLADARDFVANIHTLDNAAKAKGVFVCSGASSVPGLTSAILEHYKPHFKEIHDIDYAIATAQMTNRGLATTSAVLSYAGKPFKTLRNGSLKNVYGWLDLRKTNFWGLGPRLLGNCDIPDLALFPLYYPTLKNIRFQAVLEIPFLHRLLWIFSWMVSYKLSPSLKHFAKPMLTISYMFDRLGTHDSGFYMTMTGIDANGAPKTERFDIHAMDGDGLYIPTMPALILAKKLARDLTKYSGAKPCVGLVTLDEYTQNLSAHNIKWQPTLS
ncbi:MAG: potassium transporter [Magnetococcales bacterium]|nr:potassium transporter [Magnetococcales bacterium]